MNSYAVLAALALYGCTLGYAVWERSDAIQAKSDLSTLKASYATAAAAAETHAQAIEVAQAIAIQTQSNQAIQQAQDQALQARNQLTEYQAKLAKAASVKDDGHRCAGVVIPGDLIP